MEMEGDPSPTTEPLEEFIGHTHSYMKLKKRERISRKKQFCQPIRPQYDPNRYAEFVLKLDRLKNLDARDPMKPGQYVVRVSCMGQNYGHFLSGLADMGAFVTLTRTPLNSVSPDSCPDIDLSETLGLQVLFKDLMNNPVVLTLLDGRHGCSALKEEEDFATLKPIGYLCLDILELVNHEMGYTDEYCEPWILEKERVVKEKKFPWGEPMLQFSVSCIGGLPDANEFKNGNVMTVLVDSMYTLPDEILQMDHALKNEMNIYISLPMEDAENHLFFTRGKYMDENTEKLNKHKVKGSKGIKKTKSNKALKPNVTHWASVVQHSYNIPRYAAVIPEETSSEKQEQTKKLSGNISDEIAQNATGSSSPKIAWNSLHKKYVDPDNYEKVLKEFSRVSVWPLEVAITVNKEIQKHNPKAHTVARSSAEVNTTIPTTKASRKSRHSISPAPIQRNSLETSSGSHKTPSTENANNPSPVENEVQFETIIIYHGVAFFDLTQLLSPGNTSVRFASQLFPYSDSLMYEKTSIRKSVFLSTIPGYVPASDSKTLTLAPNASPSRISRKSQQLEKKEVVKESRKKHSVPINHSKEHPPGHHTVKNTNSHGHENEKLHGHENEKAQEPEHEKINGHEKANAHEKHHGHNEPRRTSENPPKNSGSKNSFEEADEDANGNLPNTSSLMQAVAPVPFIVFEITMKHPIVPVYAVEDIAKRVEEYIPNPALPRRKVINAGIAQASYRKSVIQASADLCESFHSNYLEEVVNDPKNWELLDPNNPASSCDALKKGFLLYLNATGSYLVLREHLRHSIAHVIQQRCLTLRPNGFQTRQEFQNYLHDIYIYLVDQMHDVLSKTQMNELNPMVESPNHNLAITGSTKQSLEFDKAETLKKLCIYAEEALAQGDFDNSHRLHLQRICRNGEDANTWVDFAIMWLSRGDDRMAEIAVREALRINPQHVHALLIAGLIAAKEEDKRAIDCIGSALGLQPSSPEIMVILAMVYNIFKNDVASDYYFKNARYVHAVMTGNDTANIKNEYNKLNERFDAFRRYSEVQGIEGVIQQKEKENLSGLKLNDDPRFLKVKRSSKNNIDSFQNAKVHSQELKSRSFAASENNHSGNGVPHNPHNKHLRASKIVEANNDGVIPKEGAPINDPLAGKDATFFTKRDSISANKPRPRNVSIALPHLLRPNFQFDTELNEDSLKMTLPPLIPSIQTSWDVTDPANIPISIKVQIPPKLQHPKPSSLPKVTSMTSAETEASEGSEKKEHQEEPIGFQFNPDEFSQQFIELYGEDGKPHFYVCFEDPSEENICEDEEYPEAVDSLKPKANHSPIVHDLKDNPNQPSNKITSDGKDRISKEASIKNMKETAKRNSIKNGNENADKELNENPNKKYTKRIGSEYIWTAQLLLNLRLFDFMDGVLAREVHLVETRSVQYIYLRSISLYLRHRSSEALTYVNEALEIDPSSATLWALKGHCLYRLNQHLEAIESYQKALLFPHEKEDFHLVYLRFGCLCMDHAGEDASLQLAKKIFRRGVHLYPSPYMWLAFGNTCYQLQQFEEAEEAFAEANRIDITSPMIWGHLALVSLARNDKALAEQSYKWAVRFGLREGPMVDEIKRLHVEKGFGDPTFPRIPDCIPHDYYLRRVDRDLPFDMYKEALYQEPPPTMGYHTYNDTDREAELKKRLEEMKEDNLPIRITHDPKFKSEIHLQVLQDDDFNDKEKSQKKNIANKDFASKERDKRHKTSKTVKHDVDKIKRKPSHTKGKGSTDD